MRAVVQRVTRASVQVGDEIVGRIDGGMLVLVCAMAGDTEAEAERLAGRIARFRFFGDEGGRMNRSVLDVGLAALVVSQFTLSADGRKGRRPSFDRAAPPELAAALVDRFVAALADLGVPCATGRFGAAMAVELVNDGPVTFHLEERPEGPEAP